LNSRLFVIAAAANIMERTSIPICRATARQHISGRNGLTIPVPFVSELLIVSITLWFIERRSL
jgi:hypothetical protein